MDAEYLGDCYLYKEVAFVQSANPESYKDVSADVVEFL